jgi:hypothetical protein
MTARPIGTRLRTYRVGLGDCLLLTVTYGSALPDGRRQRHMLVDCGTAATDRDGPSLADVARHVAEHCDGKLDVLVATHRHPEHVCGFADPETRAALAPLAPDLVVRPWTDDPERVGFDEPSREFLTLLERLYPEPSGSLLAEWTARTVYLSYGDVVGLDELMPGVTATVLGPPGPTHPDALLAPARNTAGPWLRPADDPGPADLVSTAPPRAWDDALGVLAGPGGAGAAEPLLRRLRDGHLSPAMELTAAVHDVVHDTSVVLLVTVGARSLLLPGDAQQAGWSTALDRLATSHPARDRTLARRLAQVDVYKVGRHGAAAGTPWQLYRHWHRRDQAHPLVSVLSTGRSAPAVDRVLLDDLENRGPVFRTDDVPPSAAWLDVEVPAHGRHPVTTSTGPVVR